MLDDNVKGGSSTPWSRLKDPLRVLSAPRLREPGPLPGGAPSPTPVRAPGASAAKVQSVFAVLGIVTAIAGAIWVWTAERSFALSLFVFVVLLVFVGIGLGDAFSRDRKIRGLLAYTFFPLFTTGILIGTYRLWEMWWLAALLGFFGGLVVWAVVAAVVFPDVMTEGSGGTDVR